MMMKRKFWWVDTTDLALALAKVEAVRTKQLSDWHWASWDEQDFFNPQEAELSLLREIGIPSIFSDGKVVCCQGLPTFHQKISKMLDEIPDGILLIVMAPVLRTTSLYLKAKKDNEKFEVDELEDISDPKKRLAFISERAEKIGVRLDNECCHMLAQMCGNSRDMISVELKKLKAYSEDGTVTHSDILAVCVGEGEAVLFELTSKILARNTEQAHEWMKRLLISTDPHAVVGFLCSWARVMCLVAGCKCDVERSKTAAAGLYKLEKIEGNRAKKALMYPTLGRFYHAAKELEGSPYAPYWPWVVMAECHRLEFATRFITGKDDLAKETHRFLERIMSEEGASSLRPIPLPAVITEREDRRKTKKYEVVDESPKND